LESGIGLLREPTKPVTPGVPDQSPGVVGHLHVDEHVAGHRALLGLDLWPSFISEICSVGTTTWRTPLPAHRMDAVLEFCLTLFSCPE
jgi:hypothetical protein